jgi:hypothetical protein
MLGHASMLIAAQACAGMIARRLPASRIRGPAGRDSGGARVPPSGLHMVRLCRFCEAQAAAKLSLQTAITMLLLPLLHMNPIPSGCCTELSKLDLDGIQSRPTLLRVLAQCLPSAWFIGLVNEAYSGKRRMSALVRTHVDVCSACVRSKCLATMLPDEVANCLAQGYVACPIWYRPHEGTPGAAPCPHPQPTGSVRVGCGGLCGQVGSRG